MSCSVTSKEFAGHTGVPFLAHSCAGDLEEGNETRSVWLSSHIHMIVSVGYRQRTTVGSGGALKVI